VAVAGVLWLGSFLATGAEKSCAEAVSLTGVWDEARKAQVGAAFRATEKPYSEFALGYVNRVLDAYASSWKAMQLDACHARGQSDEPPEVNNLRKRCLSRRREELAALVELFAQADAHVVERATGAAHRLTPIGTCTNLSSLARRVPLPTDPATSRQVDVILRQVTETETLLKAGKLLEAERRARHEVAEARRLGYRPLEAQALLTLGVLQHELKRPDSDQTLHLALEAAIAGRDERTEAEAWIELVFVHGYIRAEFQLARRAAGKARAALERLGGDAILEAKLLYNEGGLLDVEGRVDDSIAVHRRALELRERAFGAEHPDVANSVGALAVGLTRKGRHPEAFELFERALRTSESELGEHHPKVATVLSNRAIALNEVGRSEEALADLRRAVAIREHARGRESLDVAAALNNLCLTFLSLGRNSEAMEACTESVAIAERTSSGKARAMISKLNSLGEAQRANGLYADALRTYVRSLKIAREVVGPDHPMLAYDLVGIGEVHLARRRYRKAVAVLERAVALREAKDVEPLRLAEARFALARALVHFKPQRSRALALLAHDAFVEGHAEKQLAEVKAWLGKRKPKRDSHLWRQRRQAALDSSR
jgi:tetratricopeptide (TPR) repeat protein